MRSRPAAVLLAAGMAALFPATARAQGAQDGSAPEATVAQAREFMDRAEARLFELTVRAYRAGWVNLTFLTDDTDSMMADANDALLAATTELVRESRRFATVELPPDLARKLHLLPQLLDMPGPPDAGRRAELARIAAALGSKYGKLKYCPNSGPYKGKCLGQSEMAEAFSTTRDPAVLKDLWLGWHAQGPTLREEYARFVELANEGARDLGFADVGEVWRSRYDMPSEQMREEAHRVWEELRPLYLSLHAYVRGRLAKRYGSSLVPPGGMLPAHLLGDLWGQNWDGIYDLVAPPRQARAGDLSAALSRKRTRPVDMVRYGEGFYVSLGFPPLPNTFWKRSQFSRPRDREVVCHAQAWWIENPEDVRLLMCINVDARDFAIVHHELGHLYYSRSCKDQSFLFGSPAQDGFDEAIGDSIALSVTPAYLRQIGLSPGGSGGSEGDIPALLRQALYDVAFLPWGLLVDEWRWGVFSRDIGPDDYNSAWWRLRAEYEGVAPPAPRTDQDFDPGVKYHIPANIPYMRYFLASLFKYQFYRGMCRASGYVGPLHRCSFYGSKAAGEKLNAMLSLGRSRPWPEALRAFTGEEDIDASALLEYFAPLKAWLDEQNRGQKLGW
jgi:peptidyl-dipeptidase A